MAACRIAVILLMGAVLCVPQEIFAYTLETFASADCSACTGEAYLSISDENFLPPYTYRWYDEAGNDLFVEESNLNQSGFSALCIGVYGISVSDQSGAVLDVSNNIATTSSNPGENITFYTCENGDLIDLAEVLQGEDAGGDWTLEGNPVGSIFNPTTSAPGTYTYHYTFNEVDCAVYSEVTIVVNQNANPGSDTNYLYCENWNPFNMTDVLAGNPDEGGQWLRPDGTEIDGLFIPGVSDAGTFFYRIEIPGCSPVQVSGIMSQVLFADAGTDSMLTSCATGVAIDLFDYLGGSPDLNGTWFDLDNNPFDGTVTLDAGNAGEYRYHAPNEQPCPNANAFITVNIATEPSESLSIAQQLCIQPTSLNLQQFLPGTIPFGGDWTGENGQNLNGELEPGQQQNGIYTYEVDINGCGTEIHNLELDFIAPLDAGPAVNADFCVLQLVESELLHPAADIGGSWFYLGEAIALENFTPVEGGNYTLVYRHDDANCPIDEAFYSISFDESVYAGEDVSVQICDDVAGVSVATYLSPNAQTGFWLTETGQSAAPLVSAVPGLLQSFEHIVNSSNAQCPNDTATIYFETISSVPDPPAVLLNLCETEALDLVAIESQMEYPGEWELQGSAYGGNSFFSAQGDSIIYQAQYGEACLPQSNVFVVEWQNINQAGENAGAVVCESSEALDLTDFLFGNFSENGVWSFQDTQIPASISVEEAGSSFYSYVVEETNGVCPADIADINIVVQAAPNFAWDQELIFCYGDMIDLSYDVGAEYEVLWGPIDWFGAPTETEPMLLAENIAAEGSTVELTLAISDGVCYVSLNNELIINPLPNVNAGFDVQLCSGNTAQLQGSGALSYSWWPTNAINDSELAVPVFVGDETTTLTLTGTTLQGCTATDEVDVEVLQLEGVAVLGEDKMSCAPGFINISLEISQPESVQEVTWWANGEWAGNGNEFSFNTEQVGIQNFTAQVTTSDGCTHILTETPTLEIMADPRPSFSLTSQTINWQNETSLAQFEQTGEVLVSTLEWTLGGKLLGNTSEVFLDLEEVSDKGNLLCLTATSDFGCSATDCRFISVDFEPLVFVPNAFTPDGDGLNDTFGPQIVSDKIVEYSFQIYNRWGEAVFEANDLNERWSGNQNFGNYFVAPGTYSWVLVFRTDENLTPVRKVGSVSVLR